MDRKRKRSIEVIKATNLSHTQPYYKGNRKVTVQLQAIKTVAKARKAQGRKTNHASLSSNFTDITVKP